jgi:hypothetical protein
MKMKKRMTGASELSKKLLTVMLLSISATSWATDNSIYIDQTGDNSTITMTQDGSGNRVKGILSNGTAGTNTDPAKLVGNNQTITVNKAGPNNILTLGANSTVGTNGKGIDINYQVDVGGNVGFINSNNNGLGVSASNLIDIIQLGGNAAATISMLGNTNSLTVRSSGGGGNSVVANIDADNVIAVVDQTLGGGNDTTLNLTGNKGGVNITSMGATNISSVTQSGGGTMGNDVKIVLDGSGNQTTVSQAGVSDNAVDYKVLGSNNIASIVQSGGLSIGQYAKVDIAGSNNDVGITQQGSVDNATNIKITGSFNTYRILQKN